MADPSLDAEQEMHFQLFLQRHGLQDYNELEEVEFVEGDGDEDEDEGDGDEDEDEDDGDEDEDEDEDDDDGEDDEDDDEEYVPVAPATSPRVSQDGPSTSNRAIALDEDSEDCVDGDGNKRRRTDGGDACSSLGIGAAESSQGNECNRSDVDGSVCPICMDTWTDDGEHHICCLPCGHIYGMSCIKRWLQQRKNSGKCPQCSRKCTINDVRKLYASRVVAIDEESHKKIQSLEAKCASLERKGADWHKKEVGWKKREAELDLKVQELTERNTHLERLLEDMWRRQSVLVNANGDCQWKPKSEHNFGTKVYGKGSYCTFELQKAFQLDGARVFDMNASNQISLIAQKPKEMGGLHRLTKLSLMSPHEMEDILLPSTSNAIRDLHFSPTNGSLALYATIGKKLSVLSTESNNIVVSYDLKVPAWSCSWDLNSSQFVYAGLQNGSVLVFDMRQTAGPMNSLNGLSCNPVHTIQSIKQSSGVRTILSASAIGLCQWNIGAEEGPHLIPETNNQGVCISLAYCPTSDDIVASYRPKFDMPTDVLLSQLPFTPSGTGQGVLGSNVLFKREGGNHYQKLGSSCANLSNIRLPRCVIADTGNESRLFAFEDEVNHELVLQELPSFRDIQRFKSPDHVRDVKYSHTDSHGLLGCLSENSMMLFGTKLS